MLASELFKILEGTADGAFAVDEQGLICSWNRAAERLFGYKKSEVLDKPCAGLFQGRGNLGTQICAEPCSVIECTVEHRAVSNYDMEVETRHGKKLWVNVSILAFHDERAHRHLVVHLTRDVTARRRCPSRIRSGVFWNCWQKAKVLPGLRANSESHPGRCATTFTTPTRNSTPATAWRP
jgi:PAS domain S-box-containing protein